MTKLKYQPEIDGLRALAVILVILYHAEIELFSGGYIGVDIFFLISGYLLTKILLINKKKINLINFYFKRINRILPNLIFYILLTCIIGIFLLPPHLLKELGESSIANIIFSSNIYFYSKTDYFNEYKIASPLLHTWSLSLEKQFYIILPFFFLFFKKIKSNIKIYLFLFFFFSLIISEFFTRNNQYISFYFLHTRIWEFFFGSIIAINEIKNKIKINIDLKKTFTILGIFIILFCVMKYDNNTIYPGIHAFLPLFGTVLILISQDKKNSVNFIFKNKLTVFLGVISYSLYLSHHIIFSYSKFYGFDIKNIKILFILIFLTFVLSIFSYKFVETPFRNLKFNFKNILSYIVAIFFCLTISLSFYFTKGFEEMKYSFLNLDSDSEFMHYDKVFKEREDLWKKALINKNTKFSANKKNILIIGDSLGEDFYVSTTLNKFNKSEFSYLKLDENCMNSLSDKKISSKCKIKLIKIYKSQLYRDAEEILLVSELRSKNTNSYKKFILKILDDKKEVTFLSNIMFRDVNSISYEISSKKKIKDQQHFFYKNLKFKHLNIYRNFEANLKKENINVRFINKLNAFCNILKKKCILKYNNNWLFFDQFHLTKMGAVYFSKKIKKLKWYN